MTGRPTKLDETRAEAIEKSIAAGGSRLSAAAAAGVHDSTLREWLQRGAKGEEPYAAFRARIKRAEAEAEQAMVGIVREAALDGTWQAAAWWLERRRAKTYALKRDMKVEFASLNEEQARAKYRELAGKDWGT